MTDGTAAGVARRKILHVDLSTRQTRAEILPETVVRKYLGGGALASYILLRDVPRLPFGTNLIDVERAASTLSVRNPVVILENDSLMFAGTTLLNAFDRLEVAEYSAKAIIAARELGDIVAIGPPQVEELVAAFNLDK